MGENKVLLLAQLVNNLNENFANFEKSYNSSDKQEFDTAKKALIESQRQINFLLSKK